MGVPFHDERDCAFALKNNLEMIQVIDGDEEQNLAECTLSNSGKFNRLKVPEAVK
jgi:leucyl-tRNA synthetase